MTVGHGGHIADVLNNGHTVQVNHAGADTLAIGDTSFALVQYHFHGPSEHTVDGKHSPMEMHLVHKSADGKLAVVGVLIAEGGANAAFDPVWAKLPKAKGDDRALGALNVDVDALMPKNRDAYWYDGSLTTPPCSEGVKWFVMRSPIQLSAAQIQAFRGIIHDNNRPTSMIKADTWRWRTETYEANDWPRKPSRANAVCRPWSVRASRDVAMESARARSEPAGAGAHPVHDRSRPLADAAGRIPTAFRRQTTP